MILAIDPGPKTSGYVFYSTSTKRVTESLDEAELLTVRDAILDSHPLDHIVIEKPVSYGRYSGGSAVSTAIVAGKLWGFAWSNLGIVEFLTRAAVCKHFTGLTHPKAADQVLRDILIQKFGGDKATAVGTKKNPGPLYGVKSHAWQALALAVAYAEGARDEGA